MNSIIRQKNILLTDSRQTVIMSANDRCTDMVAKVTATLSVLFNLMVIAAIVVHSAWNYIPARFNIPTTISHLDDELFNFHHLPPFIADKHLYTDVIVLVIVIHSLNILVIYFNKRSKLIMTTLITCFLYLLLLLLRSNQNLIIIEFIVVTLSIVQTVLAKNKPTNDNRYSMSVSMIDSYDQQL